MRTSLIHKAIPMTAASCILGCSLRHTEMGDRARLNEVAELSEDSTPGQFRAVCGYKELQSKELFALDAIIDEQACGEDGVAIACGLAGDSFVIVDNRRFYRLATTKSRWTRFACSRRYAVLYDGYKLSVFDFEARSWQSTPMAIKADVKPYASTSHAAAYDAHAITVFDEQGFQSHSLNQQQQPTATSFHSVGRTLFFAQDDSAVTIYCGRNFVDVAGAKFAASSPQPAVEIGGILIPVHGDNCLDGEALAAIANPNDP